MEKFYPKLNCGAKKVFLFSIIVLSARLAFTQAPVINSFTYPQRPGGYIVISGSNFSPAISGNTVYIGAAKATVKVAGASSLSVVVPYGATYQPITVTVNNLTGYSALSFVSVFPTDSTAFSNNSFSSATAFPVGTWPRSVKEIDFDGDGKNDLFITNGVSNTGSVLRNTGTIVCRKAGHRAWPRSKRCGCRRL